VADVVTQLGYHNHDAGNRDERLGVFMTKQIEIHRQRVQLYSLDVERPLLALHLNRSGSAVSQDMNRFGIFPALESGGKSHIMALLREFPLARGPLVSFDLFVERFDDLVEPSHFFTSVRVENHRKSCLFITTRSGT
jgi:hypothetical protein